MLEAIKYVDEVLEYDTEQELLWLLESSRPDVRLLGDDYLRKDDWTGRALCAELNIPTYYMRRVPHWSASEFRERIQSGRHWKP